jgi:hypothetical protein
LDETIGSNRIVRSVDSPGSDAISVADSSASGFLTSCWVKATKQQDRMSRRERDQGQTRNAVHRRAGAIAADAGLHAALKDSVLTIWKARPNGSAKSSR